MSFQIEEATCSNDATTSESVVEVNPLLLQVSGNYLAAYLVKKFLSMIAGEW